MTEFPEEWQSSRDVKNLCKKAGGLFIYTSTSSRPNTISPPRGSTSSHARKAPSTEVELTSSTPKSYNWRSRMPIQANSSSIPISGMWRGGAVSVPPALEEGSLEPSQELRNTVPDLHHSPSPPHSSLTVPDSEDEPIRVFHKSFPDFLTDRTRCKDEGFFIDPSVHHEDILFSCFDLMKERLKKNICDLDNYAVLVENLSALKETCIGSSLEYVCRLWARHLASVLGNGPGGIQEAMDVFFTKYLLYWIEVLSIVGHLRVAVYAINDTRQWYISVSYTRPHSRMVCPHPLSLGGYLHWRTGRR